MMVIPVVVLMGTAGCVTSSRPSMTYEACAASSECVIRGVATAELGEHGQTVKLQLDDGRCVNVSLPRERWDALRASGPTEMTIMGGVYREPQSQNGEEVVLEINGRTIGFGLCGDFFVFVRR
jgi:hypothetical protein